MNVVVCGPSQTYGRTVRDCYACKITGEHISQWLGAYHGHDHHCLTCGVTDMGGHLEPVTPESQEQWARAADLVLPTDLFERVRGAEEDLYGPKNHSVAAERRLAAALDEVLAEAAAYLSSRSTP